ncbi:hypothetical protein LQZ19_11560 [Treponema primitia]|uniref:hypothetical protein n=1 Tax=Treponema primitia TaxID=88058 RepID=UPI0039817313
MEKSKLSLEMEKLIEENTALKEANKLLLDLVDNYDKELNITAGVLTQTTEKLNEAMDFIDKITANDGQIDAI